MKISSKSIMSPSQSRLRNSGSIKGGAMFHTTAAKKRGSLDGQEPSSPKVTCIGQVRVRSKKKQAKKLTSLSRRHSVGEVSFKDSDHPLNGFASKSHDNVESLNLGSNCSQSEHWGQERLNLGSKGTHNSQERLNLESKGTQNDKKQERLDLGSKGSQNNKERLNLGLKGTQSYQERLSLGSKSTQYDRGQESLQGQRRWVHFPVTICDALRAFGSEFSCLFPCRTKYEKTVAGGDERQGSCGATIARWLVAVQDGDGGGEREIDMVVGEGESVRKSRRHVFEDLQIVNDRIEGHKDEARVSICVPPKNALLLMRCRSDPVKVQALASRSWEPNVAKTDENDELIDNESQHQENVEVGQKQVLILNQDQDQEHDNEQQDEVSQGQDQQSLYLVPVFGEIVNQDYEVKEHNESEKVLPDCLLMMMYEPKLSMEVSKETWVCRKDFIQRQSSRRKPPPAPAPIRSHCGDESSVSASASVIVNDVMRVVDGGFPTVLAQPARSSCSLPAASMAMLLEKKLADAVGYEPFVLKRCKSEPMKTAVSKLQPESCVLENMKLERLNQVTFEAGYI